MVPQHVVTELLPPTRFLSPSAAGGFVDIPLPVSQNCSDYEELSWIVSVHGTKSTDARFKMRLDDSVDGHTTRTHTAALIASTQPEVGAAYTGDADRDIVQLDRLHPFLQIGSNPAGSGSQWMVLSVHQQLKRFRPTVPEGGVRRLGTLRLDSGTTANVTGYPMQPCELGPQRRVVAYHVSVLDALANAQLGCVIQNGADGARWATQKAHASAVVTAPTLVAYDCDMDLAIGPLVRPVFKMQSGTGFWCVIEVWEITKTVRG
jgi:hypothetical protein